MDSCAHSRWPRRLAPHLAPTPDRAARSLMKPSFAESDGPASGGSIAVGRPDLHVLSSTVARSEKRDPSPLPRASR